MAEIERDGLVFRLVGGGLVCALNAGRRPMALPVGELILASAAVVDGKLPPNAAACAGFCASSRKIPR